VDVAALLRGAAAPFAPRVRTAGVTLSIDAPDGLGIRADRERLRQALANLIDNALDALATAGTPERRLALTAAAADGGVTLRVSDNGPGAAPDVLSRLFEPFFTGKAHGTGLGLAIVRRTVEAHGGSIRADGTNGMTFEIGLPVAGPVAA
jgi:C4-dicarboxylate-specific signal transduction histidine kinase